MEEWTSVKKELPKVGMMCKCKSGDVEFTAIYVSTLGGEKKFISQTDREVEYWQIISRPINANYSRY